MPATAADLADLAAIRDVVLRYCSEIDRLDPELMRSAYWPDATDDHGTFNGNAWEFVDRCMRTHARWRATMHCTLNCRVELDPDGETARGETYNVTYLFPSDAEQDSTGPEIAGHEIGGVQQWCGRYLDRFTKRGDEWRISERVCVHEGTVVLGGPPMPIDPGAFRPGSFDRPSAGRRLGP